LGHFPGPLGLLPLIFEFPYSRYISPHFSQISTSIITSFCTVLSNGLTQTSFVVTLHPGMLIPWAQPIHGPSHGPPHSWKRLGLTSTVTPAPHLYSFFSFSLKSKTDRSAPVTTIDKYATPLPSHLLNLRTVNQLVDIC